MAELQSSPSHKTALIPIGKSRPEVHVKGERWDQASSKSGNHASGATGQTTPSVRTVLEEVFELLEDYAPLWYTEAHHDRILAALRARNE
jgi:hypothetical protein